MTTLAYRAGVLAGDSCATIEGDGDRSGAGDCLVPCEKIYRIKSKKYGRCIVALEGESSSGLVFLDWLRGKIKTPDLSGSKFGALVLTKSGLLEFDCYLTPEAITEPFYASGTGAKAAYGALHMGASAKQAVEIACKIDPYSRPPVVAMTLQKAP